MRTLAKTRTGPTKGRGRVSGPQIGGIMAAFTRRRSDNPYREVRPPQLAALLVCGLRYQSSVPNLVGDCVFAAGLGGALMPCDRPINPMG